MGVPWEAGFANGSSQVLQRRACRHGEKKNIETVTQIDKLCNVFSTHSSETFFERSKWRSALTTSGATLGATLGASKRQDL